MESGEVIFVRERLRASVNESGVGCERGRVRTDTVVEVDDCLRDEEGGRGERGGWSCLFSAAVLSLASALELAVDDRLALLPERLYVSVKADFRRDHMAALVLLIKK